MFESSHTAKIEGANVGFEPAEPIVTDEEFIAVP